MGLMQTVREKPAVGAAAAVVILAAAAFILTRGSGTAHVIQHDQVYYLDLSSRQLFTAPAAVAPIDAPQGGAGQGVRAYVYACGACSEASRKPVYLEKMSDTGKQQTAAGASTPEQAEQMAQIAARETLVAAMPAAGEEPKWAPSMGEAGDAVRAAVSQLCSDGGLTECFP